MVLTKVGAKTFTLAEMNAIFWGDYSAVLLETKATESIIVAGLLLI